MALLPRLFRGGLVAALGCGFFLTLTANAAHAHDSLKSSSPARDAQVDDLKEIELDYSAQVRFPVVVMRDGAGKAVAIGTARVDGSKVLADVTASLSPGGYVIAWRVVSSDGHPIEGEIPFTVTGSGSSGSGSSVSAVPTTSISASSAAASTEGSADVSPEPSPSVAAPTTIVAPAVQASASAVGAGGASRSPGGWIWGGLVALAVVGLFVWLRNSRGNPPGQPEEQSRA
ncbi:copper resistance protein CopC [Microtetraspora sp. AC03309]|uniref:copper resistance CopC family protein n=1 Tax=Microtetraspora sp. AC03309 TaxID=2779376 RepID=UPI001E59F921|nr:copper resistance protein CopC [Microtetraspora sp. AC03309]MCC5582122.1 copper resistance protein CopC [Microtetraspora sp. AC03309]